MTLKAIYSLRFLFVRAFWRSIALLKALRAYTKGWEFITGVAIISKGVCYQRSFPYRHNHCIHDAFLVQKKQVVTSSQGFITNRGRYVDRIEGLAIARNAKQILPRKWVHPTELFSESIW